MGICLPKSLQLSQVERLEIASRYEDIRIALMLDVDDVWHLHRAFLEANRSESGSLSLDEWQFFLDTAEGTFARRVYEQYTDDKSGMTFRAWLLACWSICTRDADNLVNFAFQMYDVKGRGELGLADVRLLLIEIFGLKFREKETAEKMYHVLVRFDYQDKALEAHVTLADFFKYAKASPILCQPAFRLQTTLSGLTLGARGWENVTARRNKAVKAGTFDVLAVVQLANLQRGRDASVVPLDARHIVPFRAATGVKMALVESLPGLRTYTKVAPEEDYGEVNTRRRNHRKAEEEAGALAQAAEEAAERLRESIKVGLKEAWADPLSAAGTAASLAGMALKNVTVAAAKGVDKAVFGSVTVQAIEAGALVPAAAGRRGSTAAGRRASIAAEMRRLDVAPSLPSDDHAMDGIASLAERKREAAVRGRRASDVRAAVKAGTAARRASQVALPPGGGRLAEEGGASEPTRLSAPMARGEGPADSGVGRQISSTSGLSSLPRIQAMDAAEDGSVLAPRLGRDAEEGEMPMAPRRGRADEEVTPAPAATHQRRGSVVKSPAPSGPLPPDTVAKEEARQVRRSSIARALAAHVALA